MIGAKTLVTAILCSAGLAAALGLGILAPERLANRGLGTLFLVGCFGVVVGTLLYRFWRLGERSRHYFRWAGEEGVWASADETHFFGGERRRITIGNNRGEAFDLPPRLQHVLSIAIALLLALGCIDARALGQLDRVRHSRTAISSSYCPAPEAETSSAADPNAPGCELIRRAFALGYATSLGECAPARPRATASALCTRRQLDEPLFHYAWRLLARTWSGLRAHTEASYFAGLERDFGQRVDHLAQLRASQRQILTSAPHAAHHIFTNLPDPGDGAFRAETCADRYRWLPHRPAATGASKVFEHVVAQLLFESRYEPAAGTCREYHVHWNAPLDTCTRIAATPDAVLAAFDDVRSVLERQRLNRDLATRSRAPALAAAAFVSFQCYFETGERARSSTAFSFAGQRFTVEELRVAPAPANAALYIDRYDAVARLLVRGFHYGALLSEAGLEPGTADGLQAAFAGHDYLLTRLYGLDSLDLYLDANWMASRPDLLEVYPYQRHLKNYVQIFRRQYQRERGRL